MLGPRFFEWFQFCALACLLLQGLVRMVRLQAQRVNIFVVDRQRTPVQMAEDLVMLVCLLIWAYESVAWAFALRFHFWSASLPVDGTGVRLAGAAMELAGLILYGLAIRALGKSWRLGIDRNRPGPLMTGGIYGRMRHPIFVAFDLVFLGSFLAIQRVIFLCIAVVMALMLHMVMLREERFLTLHYGDAYRDYCRRVGRYL